MAADISIKEIEKLLESPIHEVRAGAVSFMDKASRNKKNAAARQDHLTNCTCGGTTGSTIGISLTWVAST